MLSKSIISVFKWNWEFQIVAVKGKFFVGTTRLSDSFKTWQNEEIKENVGL